jgi:hypothetical protein
MYRFHSPSGSNNTRTISVLNRDLSQVLVESGTQTLKTLLGILVGLALLLGGWIIFSSEGFYSPVLFLTGTLMMPLGLLLLGTSLTGGFGESPRNMLDRYRGRNREP